MIRLLFAVLIVAATVLPAHAIFTEKPLENPQQEARAQVLMKELRCLVCQNQAISESHAPLARDLRVVLRERIAAGDSDSEALDYMVERFGDWVLLNPPLKPKTNLLWFGVPIIFLIGATITFFYLRRRPGLSAAGGPTGASRPLTEEEQAELRRALTEKE